MGNCSPCKRRKTGNTFSAESIEKLFMSKQKKNKENIRIQQSFKIDNLWSIMDVEDDPRIINLRCYFGHITREEVVSYLRNSNRESGTYLVRKPISVSDCSYVVSILVNDSSGKCFIKNIKIYKSRDKQFYFHGGVKCKSVADLLQIYKETVNLVKTPCINTNNFMKVKLDPLSYWTHHGGEIQIQRQFIYNLPMNTGRIELTLNTRTK